ncbi:MAG: NAD(P)-dependent oxidoreductase [Alphaproteobacteria bacterium]
MSAGFIGAGSMGLGIAGNILGKLRGLTVYDIDPARIQPLAERQARVAASPREVADREAVVLQCLPSNKALDAVVNGPNGVKGGKAMKVFVNLGVTGRATVEAIAESLGEAGVAVVDAPISGGSLRAREGTLTIMVSGDPAAIEMARPMLEAASTKIVHIGDKPGQAQMMKLVNNIISAGNFAVAAEAMLLGAKAGLNPETMLEVINSGTAQNSATLAKIPGHVLTRGFDYGSKLHIIRKDLVEWLHETEAAGVPSPTCLAARQMFETAAAMLGDQADFTEAMKVVETMSRFEMPKTR